MTRSPKDETIADLPPSAIYLLHVLRREAPASRQALLEETKLAERTLDRALMRLQNDGFIVRTRDNSNLNRTVVKMAAE